MDSYGELKLSWSLGYNGSKLHFVTEGTLAYGCGNTLTFVKVNGEHHRSLQSEGRGVAYLTTCHKTQVVAYSEDTLKPRIFGIEYPSFQLKFVLEGGADLEYTSFCFSSDGKRMISLSGVPDFRLVVWDCSENIGQCLCSERVEEGGIGLSVNPLNWRQFFLLGSSSLTLWNAEKCGTELKLTPLDIDLPEKSSEVGAKTAAVTPTSPYKSPAKSVRTEMTAASTMTLYAPPNMAEVYYRDTYEEYIRKREPVVPKCVCWTAKQCAYVGCGGGQLMTVEADTGSATLLVNPHPPSEEGTLSASSSSSELITKTSHSEMKAGSAECMLLSPRGIFTAGNNGLLQCFSTPKLELLDEVVTGQPVKQLSWSPSCSKIAIGMANGSICTTDAMALSSSLVTLSNHQHSRLTGIDILCQGSEYCVTCRTDGYVQIWRIEDGALISFLILKEECSCIACPLSCKLAVVGTSAGNLCMISLADLSSPRLIQKTLVHSQPVMGLRHDQSGLYLTSFSPDDPVFIHDSRPSTKFATLGYFDVLGEVLDVSIIPLKRNNGSNYAQVAVLLCSQDGTRAVSYFEMDNSFLDEKPSQLYIDATKKLSKDFVRCKTAFIPELISDITLTGDAAFTFINNSQKMAKFNLASVTEEDQKVSFSHLYESHDLGGVKTALSFHQSWLVSVSQDGKLLLRLVDDPSRTLECTPHLYKNGGCSGICFTRDSQSLLTTGDSGSITCWKIQFSRLGSQKSTGAVGYFKNVMRSLEGRQATEDEFMMSLPPIEADAPQPEKTWLTLTKEAAHIAEDEQYSKTKAELRSKIDSLRNRVLDMITTNENLPELEQLGRQEFILDTEEHQRLLAEQEEHLQKVREDIEFSILATKFLRQQIKQECWDKMAMKGKTVKAFQGSIEVSNYPMVARTKVQLDELERVKYLAQIDAVERKLRKEAGQEIRQTLQPLHHDQDLYDDEDYLGDVKDNAAQGNDQDDQGDPDAVLGSHRANFGVECDLLASQFELHSPVYKRHQIILLEDCIHRLKESFNKEFDEVLRMKSNEITRIREKNVRILKIITQLKLDEPLVQPSLSNCEQPEKVLIVEDSEMTIVKYVSPEEQQHQEEQSRLEEERRLASMGDNPRERALDMMMGGRLEANVEEDLFKDMPRPDFMSKEQAEMTEDEIRMARDFEKKEAAFLEEREKMKKALEAELKKLQSSIAQGMEQYDERVQKLFQLKMATQTTIQQEELKIHHLARALFIEKEIKMKEEELNNTLEEKKIKKVQLGSVISTAKRKVDEVKENYDVLVAEDRDMDKTFRKDFADCEPCVDQLYKLFKKRPRGHRLKLMETTDSVNVRASSPASTSKTMSSKSVSGPGVSAGGAGRVVENVMAELDHISYIPEGLDAPAWDRFVAHRHKKVESESKTKAAALELAEINAFLQRRLTEEDNIQQDIQNAFKELSKLQEDKMIFELNLEIQFLLKQGQVEGDMGDFTPDFSDSVLIHRSRIEELNSQIKTLGEAKINSMLECKDFKRGIRMLDWERQKMKLEGEGLLDQGKDIQLMRVTKELLNRLLESDLLSKDARQKEVLDKTFQLNEKVMQKTLTDKRKTVKDFNKKIKAKRQDNRELDQNMRELQVSVAECSQLLDLAGIPPSEANRLQRMRDIVARRKLVEEIKAQDAQYAELKVELERLRMKSFPALVQLD